MSTQKITYKKSWFHNEITIHIQSTNIDEVEQLLRGVLLHYKITKNYRNITCEKSIFYITLHLKKCKITLP